MKQRFRHIFSHLNGFGYKNATINEKSVDDRYIQYAFYYALTQQYLEIKNHLDIVLNITPLLDLNIWESIDYLTVINKSNYTLIEKTNPELSQSP